MSHKPAYSSPMLARTAESVGGKAAVRAVRQPPPVLPADPDAAADAVLALMSEERFQSARRLAAEAVARFPEHPRVRGLWAIFDTHGKAKVGSEGPQPSRAEDFAWLRNPPEWARGKWVALVAGQAVAAADTLAEVAESLRSQSFDRIPLVHHIG